MTLELKKPGLVKHIEQLASATQQPAEQVLEEAVQAYLDELDRAAIHAETQHFWAMQAELAERYPGEHVALREGQVVDHDADVSRLAKRVRERFGVLPVLIAPVAPPREFHWLGGRLEGGPSV